MAGQDWQAPPEMANGREICGHLIFMHYLDLGWRVLCVNSNTERRAEGCNFPEVASLLKEENVTKMPGPGAKSSAARTSCLRAPLSAENQAGFSLDFVQAMQVRLPTLKVDRCPIAKDSIPDLARCEA